MGKVVKNGLYYYTSKTNDMKTEEEIIKRIAGRLEIIMSDSEKEGVGNLLNEYTAAVISDHDKQMIFMADYIQRIVIQKGFLTFPQLQQAVIIYRNEMKLPDSERKYVDEIIASILEDYEDYKTDRISREPGKIFDRKECIKEFLLTLNT